MKIQRTFLQKMLTKPDLQWVNKGFHSNVISRAFSTTKTKSTSSQLEGEAEVFKMNL